MKSILLDINYLLDTILIFDLDYASNDDFLNWLTRSMLFFFFFLLMFDLAFRPAKKKKKNQKIIQRSAIFKIKKATELDEMYLIGY